jgi:hypothetical protein
MGVSMAEKLGIMFMVLCLDKGGALILAFSGVIGCRPQRFPTQTHSQGSRDDSAALA